MSKRHTVQFALSGVMLAASLLAIPLAARGADPLSLDGQLSVAGAPYTTDVWGWTDPNTNIPYVLMGNNNSGLHIIDVSDPGNPTVTAIVTTVPSFDVKAWGHYAFTDDGNYGIDGGVVDISNPSSPVVVGSFPRAHNIFIENRGFMYACGPGLRIYLVAHTENNPLLVWEDLATEGHDATVVGNTLYFFAGVDGTFIYDIVNPSAPVLLGSITDPSITYHHNGWPSSDGQYLFISDEFATGDGADFTVWDISDPSAPRKVSSWYDPESSIHNIFVRGDYLFTSFYAAGFRVFDISNPSTPFLAAEYDVSAYTGEGLKGTFGCYPFTNSGRIYVSDRPAGLFIFSFDETAVGVPAPTSPALRLHAPFPNPSTTPSIRFDIERAGRVRIDIYDVTGARVRTLLDAERPAGSGTVAWDGMRDNGRAVPSGVYFVRMSGPGATLTQRLVLVR